MEEEKAICPRPLHVRMTELKSPGREEAAEFMFAKRIFSDGEEEEGGSSQSEEDAANRTTDEEMKNLMHTM